MRASHLVAVAMLLMSASGCESAHADRSASGTVFETGKQYTIVIGFGEVDVEVLAIDEGSGWLLASMSVDRGVDTVWVNSRLIYTVQESAPQVEK